MSSIRYDVIKVYPPRGPLQQHRVRAATAFRCFRCGRAKTSKLITVFTGDWAQLLCNGCYGWLQSVYNVKANDDDAESKAEILAAGLVRLVPVDKARRCEELLILREDRARTLEPRSLRLLATSNYVATQLEGTTSLDWSAAIIGLCKAVEVELVARLIEPLRSAAQDSDLQVDIDDKDLV
jgi:hypothetical protein